METYSRTYPHRKFRKVATQCKVYRGRSAAASERAASPTWHVRFAARAARYAPHRRRRRSRVCRASSAAAEKILCLHGAVSVPHAYRRRGSLSRHSRFRRGMAPPLGALMQTVVSRRRAQANRLVAWFRFFESPLLLLRPRLRFWFRFRWLRRRRGLVCISPKCLHIGWNRYRRCGPVPLAQ